MTTRPRPEPGTGMRPALRAAIQRWRTARRLVREAAADALSTALPALATLPRTPGHNDIHLRYTGPGTGEVMVDELRATIDLAGLPRQALGDAVDTADVLICLEGPDGQLLSAPLSDQTGTYIYDDETTRAEFDIHLHTNDTGDLHAALIPVPDAYQLLAALAYELTQRSTLAQDCPCLCHKPRPQGLWR